MSISTVIITYNEAHNLPRTLAALSWCNDIVIVDSGSTDNTEAIALAHGCRFFKHAFEGYGQQKNYGAEKALNNWILSIDADEVLTASLQTEIQNLFQSQPKHAGFQIPVRHVFMNHEFKYGKESKYFHLRLYDKTKGKYNEQKVHEKICLSGTTAKLHNHLLHYSYRNVEHYFEKFNNYTSRAASSMYQRKVKRGKMFIWLSSPFYFFKHYILHGNILNGSAGYWWSVLNTWYHVTKYLKLYELNQTNNESRQ